LLAVASGRADGLEPTVVLVEGHSDKVALETLARRRGRDLAGETIYIVAMGGATNIGQYLDVFGPAGTNVELAGLYDAGEEATIRRGLMGAGLGKNLTRGDIEELGFFRCDVDLEDELIRALGTVAVEEVIGAQGELGSFRTFQNQPAQRGRPTPQQLRRFMGTRSGRKARYASLLVAALDLERVPRPLDQVLDAARDHWRPGISG
jgi:hypothetical protein